jgi:hypothetical protein
VSENLSANNLQSILMVSFVVGMIEANFIVPSEQETNYSGGFGNFGDGVK